MISLQRRYLLGALLLLVVLALALGFAERHLDHEHRQARHRLQNRQEVLKAVQSLRRSLWRADHAFSAFLLSGTPNHREEASRALSSAQKKVRHLESSAWIAEHATTGTLEGFTRTLGDLSEEIARVNSIRSDSARLFPALEIMRDHMGPAHRRFMGTVQGAIQTLSPPSELSDRSVRENFLQARHLWSRMSGEFRLYVAGRLGLLGKTGARNRAHNLEVYHQELMDSLAELEKAKKADDLGPYLAQALKTLREQARVWYAHFRELPPPGATFHWRADVPLVVQSVQPLFTAVDRKLRSLESRLTTEASRDIEAMSGVARTLTWVLWFTLLTVLTAVGLGFLFLRNRVLEPLVHLAHNLHREAHGMNPPQELPRGPREVQEVTDAFARLRLEIRARESELRHWAQHDTLTGLPNRELMEDRLSQALETVQREDRPLSLLVLDLNYFKEINDSYGHPAGDRVLCTVAERLAEVVRGTDTVSRFGGDEFGVLLVGSGAEGARRVSEKILEALQPPIRQPEADFHVGVSIGIAQAPDLGTDPETLLARADAAMYQAKSTHQGFTFFRPELETGAGERLAHLDELYEAIRQDRVELHYQPKINLGSGAPEAVEALLRWGPPEGAYLPAQEVLEMAERAGMSRHLSRSVVQRAIAMADWLRSAGRDIRVAVNLCCADLRDPDLFQQIRDQLDQRNLPGSCLELEITEKDLHPAFADLGAILSPVRAMGVRVTLDHYGTGYSSLCGVRDLPLDTLKLDRSLVVPLPDDAPGCAIVRSSVELGRSLGREVEVVGVESARARAFLEEIGCPRAQGFHLARPLEPGALADYLAGNPPPGTPS